MRWGLWLLPILLLLPATARPDEPPPSPLQNHHQKILAFALEADGVDPVLARNLTRLFTFSLRQTLPDREVVGQWEVRDLLALEGQKQLLGCEEEGGCLADIAGSLGAQVLATGAIGRIGNRYLVDLRLIDVAEAKILRQVSEQVLGDEEMAAEAVSQLAANLADPSRPVGQGLLQVQGRGEVSLDGEPVGAAPLQRLAVSSGHHTLLWQPKDSPRPTGERQLRVDPYTLVEVLPEPRQVEWDLKAIYASDGIGTSPGVQLNRKVDGATTNTDTQTSVVYRSRIGWMFPMGVGLHISHQLEAGSVAMDLWSLGVGYRFGGKLRFHQALDLATGTVYHLEGLLGASSSDDSAPANGVISTSEVTYTLDRYLELGLSLGITWGAVDLGNDNRLAITSGSLILMAGLPPWTPKGPPQQNFYESPWFWTAAGAGLTGFILSGLLLNPLRGLTTTEP
ncbi:MAG: hypothetical protein P1V51_16940 [Deltaproteobacteria bacterium]|nr:hypothetical protein [Deltaproteobacteria bacterium]